MLLGVLGLALDLGRLYVINGEEQSFADASGLAAAFEMDGTTAGLIRTDAVAVTGPTTGGAAANRVLLLHESCHRAPGRNRDEFRILGVDVSPSAADGRRPQSPFTVETVAVATGRRSGDRSGGDRTPGLLSRTA